MRCSGIFEGRNRGEVLEGGRGGLWGGSFLRGGEGKG